MADWEEKAFQENGATCLSFFILEAKGSERPQAGVEEPKNRGDFASAVYSIETVD